MENRFFDASLCEKLEIALYCGEELSDTLKEHLDACPHCKKLLEENATLTAAISGAKLTNIKDGEIADAVMKKIASSKKRKSGFSFNHHMGTAAAIVIICAAALYVKYFPSAQDASPIALDEESTIITEEEASPILSDTHFITLDASYDADDEEIQNSAITGDGASLTENGRFEEADTGAASHVTGANTPSQSILMKSARPGSISAQSETADEEFMNDNLPLTVQQPYSDITVESYNADYAAPSLFNNEAATGEESEQAILEAEKAVPFEPSEQKAPAELMYTEKESSDTSHSHSSALQDGSESSGSSGGGGSSSSAKLSSDSGAYIAYSESFLIFDELEFLQGDENLDYNISLANARLCELYGEGRFIITRYALENNGWKGNLFFFEYAPTLTYSSLISIESSSSPICG